MADVAGDSNLPAEEVQLEPTPVDGATTLATTSTSSQQAAQKEPERVYDLYSWKTKSPETRLVYIIDAVTAQLELAKLRPGPLGFDLEWKPIRWKGGYNPVALVQLASHDTILLIQVHAIRKFPERLKDILEDPSYVKAGVGIQGDVKKLWMDWRVNVRNCVDLALLARTVDNERWKGKYTEAIGLARLCRAYYELDLAKGATTKSNWELRLSELQQEYAANDCHSGLLLYQHLDAMRAAMNPIPPHIYFSFDFLNGYLYQPSQLEDVSSILWHAHNPNYDPGPLPEKKEKERKGKEKDKESAGENANPTNREEYGTNTPSSSTTQSTNPRGNGRGKMRSYPPRPQTRPLPTSPPGLPIPGQLLSTAQGGPPGLVGGHAPPTQGRRFSQQRLPGGQPRPLYNPPYVVNGYVRPQPLQGQGSRGRGRGRGSRGRGERGQSLRGGRGDRGRGRGRGVTPAMAALNLSD